MADLKKKSIRDRVRAVVRNNLPYLVVLFLLLLSVAVFFHSRILVTVHSGEAGVLYRRFFGGTVTERPFDEGFYVVAPWNRMYVYNVRNQFINHVIEVLTKRGLPIRVDLTIRFRPEYNLVGVLHQEVGPNYVDLIVKPEVEATVRTIVGQYDVAEIYTTKRAVVQKIIDESLEQVSRKYVDIDDVLITKVTLPDEIAKAIEQKMIEEQRLEAFEYRLKSEEKEAERKLIEAKGVREAQKIISETLTKDILTDKGILATRELATSPNSKVVVVGGKDTGLPIILGDAFSGNGPEKK